MSEAAIEAHRAAREIIAAMLAEREGRMSVSEALEVQADALRRADHRYLVNALGSLALTNLLALASLDGRPPSEILQVGWTAIERGIDDL